MKQLMQIFICFLLILLSSFIVLAGEPNSIKAEQNGSLCDSSLIKASQNNSNFSPFVFFRTHRFISTFSNNSGQKI